MHLARFTSFVLLALLASAVTSTAFEIIDIGGQSYLFQQIDTPTPGATHVLQVSGINNQGVIVGTFENDAHQTFGFLQGPGIPFTQISNGAFTQLLKINDSNVAVGNSVNGAFTAPVPGGPFTPVSAPAGFTNLKAGGISDQGIVVGEALQTSTGITKGFEVGGGLPFTPFSPSNSGISVFPNTVAVHPNSIALTSSPPDTLIVGRIEQSGGLSSAFLAQGNPNADISYTNVSNDLNRALQAMGIQSGPAEAQGVNGFGIIVGTFTPLPDFSRGFIDEANFFTVVDAPRSNSTRLFDINNKLQIVGGFESSLTATDHGFILTPLNSPVQGISPKNPVLPGAVLPGGKFVFTNPIPGLWYDPPFASGFMYSLEGGATFLEVAPPPASFGFGPVELVVGGSIIDILDPGEEFFFGPGVTTFSLIGISPLVDIGHFPAFPTFLNFTGSATALTMTALFVPEPSTLLLLSVGLLGSLGFAWRLKAKAK
jgi:hypothetical protein